MSDRDITTIELSTERRLQLKRMKEWRSYDQLLEEMIRQYDQDEDDTLVVEA